MDGGRDLREHISLVRGLGETFFEVGIGSELVLRVLFEE